MSEMNVEMVIDLNRIFGYTMIINDGKLVKMLDPEQDAQEMYLANLGLN